LKKIFEDMPESFKKEKDKENNNFDNILLPLTLLMMVFDSVNSSNIMLEKIVYANGGE